jgi:lipopolysaccharide export system protein LptA
MLKPLLIISLLFSVTVMDAHAQSQKAKIRGPITVNSETLTADNKANTALFERNVVAKTTDLTIQADKMLVFYNDAGGDVTKIESTGNVRVFRDARIITSKAAIYFADEEKVVFTGEPRAMDGDNIVTGSEITFFMTEDRFLVKDPKVILKNKKDQ